MLGSRCAWAFTLAAVGYATTASGADVWTTPHPGIRYLHRSTADPKEIHALLVDLTRPEIELRATRSSDKGRTTSSFSSRVGAVAAVNGDFYSSGFDPVGLAIGEGTAWSNDTASHRFIACTAAKQCEIETAAGVRMPDPRWHSAVGGNNLLVDGGAVVQTSALDRSCGSFCTTAHPRTAAGMSSDGGTLLLVVVEGRQGSLTGLSLSRLAALMLDLGAHVALNLDGGGSSAMVVDGQRVSGRPSNEPNERAVANHLAVLFDANRATTGRLVGFVREDDIFDDTAGLAGVRVTHSRGGSTRTDSRGFYEFEEVEAGIVTVTAELAGYATASDTKDVVAGTTNWKSIALSRPPPDAGVRPDTGPPDSGARVDAGPPALDAGQPAVDAGRPPVDAGSVDGGAPPADATTAPADDAGSADATTPPALEEAAELGGGCSCASTPDPTGCRSKAFGLLLVIALALVRRRRSPRRRVDFLNGSRSAILER